VDSGENYHYQADVNGYEAAREFVVAEKRGAKSGFATMRAKNLETNRVKICAEERPGLVAGADAEQGNESLLRQLLRLSRLGDAPSKETKNRLFVTREQFLESVGGTL
jgi:hypothetical protein